MPVLDEFPDLVWAELRAKGHPMVEIDDCRLPLVVLSTHLDGSRWLLHATGVTVLAVGAFCRLVVEAPAHPASTPANPFHLNETQVKVLVALAREPGGLVDREISRPTGVRPTHVEEARRVLVDRGLVIARPKDRRLHAGSLSQVWEATRAGHHALRPPAPPRRLLPTPRAVLSG